MDLGRRHAEGLLRQKARRGAGRGPLVPLRGADDVLSGFAAAQAGLLPRRADGRSDRSEGHADRGSADRHRRRSSSAGSSTTCSSRTPLVEQRSGVRAPSRSSWSSPLPSALSRRTSARRATYIHVGALFGTIMVLNVWMRILPPQRRMIAAARERRSRSTRRSPPARSERSKHNTFLADPDHVHHDQQPFPDGDLWQSVRGRRPRRADSGRVGSGGDSSPPESVPRPTVTKSRRHKDHETNCFVPL